MKNYYKKKKKTNLSKFRITTLNRIYFNNKKRKIKFKNLKKKINY